MALNERLKVHEDYTLELVDVAKIIPLRHRILRSGLPVEKAHFEGDDNPTTKHFAAILQNCSRSGEVICCASFMFKPSPLAICVRAYQLRGMATTEEFQKHGIGSQLLSFAESEILKEGRVDTIWCHAREVAILFYRKQGWESISGLFVLPDAGVHQNMAKELVM